MPFEVSMTLKNNKKTLFVKDPCKHYNVTINNGITVYDVSSYGIVDLEENNLLRNNWGGLS